MNYHTPQHQTVTQPLIPTFAIKDGELVSPENIFLKRDYPGLPYDMVKITAQNGQKIYIRRDKLSAADIGLS